MRHICIEQVSYQIITVYHEAWHGRKPSLAHLRVFGCLAYALMPMQHRRKLENKAVKCSFVGYSSKTKGYRLYHPQTKRILVTRDVVFVEDAMQHCFHVPKRLDMYDSLLPLFFGAPSHVEPVQAHVQPIKVSNESTDQPISDVEVRDALDDERTEIEEDRPMPKWLLQTLRDSKLDAPLPSHTRHGSHDAFYASDCYALVVLSLCDKEEAITFNKVENSKNWMAAMQSEFDAIVSNGTGSLCYLPSSKKAIGTK